MVRVDREAHIAASVDHCQTRVIRAADLAVTQHKAGLRFNLPVDSVVAVRKTDICTLELVLVHRTVVVAENHDVSAAKFCDARVEYQRGFVGDVAIGQHRTRQLFDYWRGLVVHLSIPFVSGY